jgi:isoleucyl-tRNA synthetase
MRLWVTSEDYREDIILSFELLEQVAEVYRRIRNTMRFMLGNLYDFDPAKDSVPWENMEELDRYILLLFNDLKKKVLTAYEAMEFHQVYHPIHNFCAVELSAFYLNIIKDRLYIYAPGDRRRRSAQTAMAKILLDLLRMLAPLLVFTCEEAYGYLPEGFVRQSSIHLEEMAKLEDFEDQELRQRWTRLMQVRQRANSVLEELRQAGTVGNSQDALLRFYATGEVQKFLRDNLTLLKEITIVSEVFVESGEMPAQASTIEFDGSSNAAGVSAEKAGGEKCQRCWVWSPGVGADPQHPQVCPRCTQVLKELGV